MAPLSCSTPTGSRILFCTTRKPSHASYTLGYHGRDIGRATNTSTFRSTPWNNLTTSGPFDKEPIWVPLSNWVNFFQSQFNVELDMYLGDPAGGPGAAEGITGLYTVARKHVAGGTADAINSLNCSTTFRDPTQVYKTNPNVLCAPLLTPPTHSSTSSTACAKSPSAPQSRLPALRT